MAPLAPPHERARRARGSPRNSRLPASGHSISPIDISSLVANRRSHALYRLLDRSHFIAVVGNSGSGKSSLVRAGLLPMLDDWWARITVQPGSAPLSSLVAALVDLAARAAGSGADLDVLQQLIEHAVRQSSFGLANALAHIPAMANKKLLVVVDQFEEIFRYADSGSRDEATHFVQILLEASRSKSYDIRVMITMRSELIGECARFQNLPEAVSASQFLVPSLSRDQREEVIRRPIDRAGGTIEPDLVERLLNDAGYELDQLPVLQHCLSRMWGLARLRAPDSPAITNSTIASSAKCPAQFRSMPIRLCSTWAVSRPWSSRFSSRSASGTRTGARFGARYLFVNWSRRPAWIRAMCAR